MLKWLFRFIIKANIENKKVITNSQVKKTWRICENFTICRKICITIRLYSLFRLTVALVHSFTFSNSVVDRQ